MKNKIASRFISFVLVFAFLLSSFAVCDFFATEQNIAKADYADLSASPLQSGDKTASLRQNKVNGKYTAYKGTLSSSAVDGVKDMEYNYGAHFLGDLSANTSNNGTTFDAYLVYGSDGYAYIYCEIYDKDIVVNDDLWNYRHWHVDSMDIYVYFGSAGNGDAVYNVVAPSGKTYGPPSGKKAPDSFAVSKTASGWSFEMSLKYNHNTTFANNSVLGIAFYYNDAYNYVSTSSYTKTTVTNRCEAFSTTYTNPTYSMLDKVSFVTSAAPKTDISILSALKTKSVAVMYPVDASPYTIKTANDIKATLGSLATVVVEGTDISSYTYAVIVGFVNSYWETKYMVDTIGYNAYGVAVFGNKVSVYGATEEMLGFATDTFNKQLNGSLTKKAIYYGYCDDVGGAGLPWLSDTTLVTDSGYGSYQLIKNGASQKQYNEYKNALVALGYKLYATNNMGGKYQSATYYNSENIVTVNYGLHFTSHLVTDTVGNISSTANSMRIMVDSKKTKSLPTNTVPSYSPSAQSVLVQVGPTNLCEILRLDNGEFIVIDSGNRGTGAAILSELAALSPDGHPVVAAWYFSHFHQDHIGGFIDIALTNDFSHITVKNVIFNFGSKQARDTASSGDQYNLERWKKCLKNSKANIIYGHAGQVHKFANATLEILYTFEDTQPYDIPYKRADQSDVRSNSTNQLCSVTLKDSQTGTSQKFMFTGDSVVEQFTLATLRYGSYLKSDFVQLSHHGWGDYGAYTAYFNNGLTFYNTVAPKYVLVPRPGDRNIRSQVDQKVVANATETFYACAADGTTGVANRLAIPYPTAKYTFPSVGGFEPTKVDPSIKSKQGLNDNLPSKTNTAISTPYTFGKNGEYVYVANTAYTNIVSDGVMDMAYNYGIHLQMDKVSNQSSYEKNPVDFDVYIVAGQDGRVHVYASVTDSDRCINVDSANWWRQDNFDFWFGFGDQISKSVRFMAVNSSSTNVTPQINLASGNANMLKAGALFSDFAVVTSSSGYVVEFSFNNNGKPFEDLDEMFFGCYVNTTDDYNSSTKTYVNYVGMSETAKSLATGAYMNPSANPKDHNKLVFSYAPVTDTGRENGVDDKVTENTKETENRFIIGNRGVTDFSAYSIAPQKLYGLDTVYTTIKSDGVKDAVYSYGLHLESRYADNDANFSKYPASFDVYVVNCQDGKLHVFIEVTDKEIELRPSSYWHRDSIDFYYEFGNLGAAHSAWHFQGSEAQSSGARPADYKVVMTENGFNVEFSFDNNGKAFKVGDEFAFGVFYNNCSAYNATDGTYTKYTIMMETMMSDLKASYVVPNNSPFYNDAVRIVSAKAITEHVVYVGDELFYTASEKTTVSQLSSLLADDSVIAEVKDKNGKVLSDTDIVGTGSIAYGTNGNKYTILVNGDVDGSGTIDATDYIAIKSHFLGNITLEGVYETVADVDKNGNIDSTDYLKIKLYFIGTGEL